MRNRLQDLPVLHDLEYKHVGKLLIYNKSFKKEEEVSKLQVKFWNFGHKMNSFWNLVMSTKKHNKKYSHWHQTSIVNLPQQSYFFCCWFYDASLFLSQFCYNRNRVSSTGFVIGHHNSFLEIIQHLKHEAKPKVSFFSRPNSPLAAQALSGLLSSMTW